MDRKIRIDVIAGLSVEDLEVGDLLNQTVKNIQDHVYKDAEIESLRNTIVAMDIRAKKTHHNNSGELISKSIIIQSQRLELRKLSRKCDALIQLHRETLQSMLGTVRGIREVI